MPPPQLIDLSRVDLDRIVVSKEDLYRLLPHRFEFQLLDGFVLTDHPGGGGISFADIHSDDWWVRGHVEGRPLLPGVLMLEMAGQTAAALAAISGEHDHFIGFGGVDRCKFRDAVVPPARLHILCVLIENRRRRINARTQGIVNGKLIFEAEVTGMAMPG